MFPEGGVGNTRYLMGLCDAVGHWRVFDHKNVIKGVELQLRKRGDRDKQAEARYREERGLLRRCLVLRGHRLINLLHQNGVWGGSSHHHSGAPCPAPEAGHG